MPLVEYMPSMELSRIMDMNAFGKPDREQWNKNRATAITHEWQYNAGERNNTEIAADIDRHVRK